MAKDTNTETGRGELKRALGDIIYEQIFAPRTRRQQMPFAIPVIPFGGLTDFDKGCILTIGSPGHDDLEVGETVSIADDAHQLRADAKVIELTPDPRFELLEQPSEDRVKKAEGHS